MLSDVRPPELRVLAKSAVVVVESTQELSALQRVDGTVHHLDDGGVLTLRDP